MTDRRQYVAESRDLSKLAPAFKARIDRVLSGMLAKGHDAYVFEAVRTAERQWWIYGCGRTEQECADADVPTMYAWPDGKIVTNAAAHVVSVHGHGLAADIISKSKRWGAPPAFWNDLGALAKQHRLTWGGAWKSPHDTPHLQYPLLRNGVVYAGPSREDRTRTLGRGMRATWAAYGADIQPGIAA
jgi:hypothetical protein